MNALLLFSLLTLSQVQSSPYLISSETPFSDKGIVRLQPDPECAKIYQTTEDFRTDKEKLKLKTCVPIKTESGNLNGIAYDFFYSDGSGLFAGTPGNVLDSTEAWESNWKVGCEKDAITDQKTCSMQRGDLRVWLDSKGRSEIYIGASHYPGSLVVLRIDKTSPLTINSRIFNGSFGYRESPWIIKRIATAKSITTRYQKWPDQNYQDETTSTYGFNESLAFIRWAVVRIK
jgi:hypothetical protein